MEHKIAVASRDGLMSDCHFGQAKRFYIYETRADACNFTEIRETAPICGNCGEADGGGVFAAIPSLLEDCHIIVCARMGPGAVRFLKEKGFRVFEAQGEISAVLNALLLKIRR
jgi:predicted Fe-Mo cluster-binding NifX family protein